MQTIPPPGSLEAVTVRFGEVLTAIGRLHPLRDPLITIPSGMELSHSQTHVLMWLGYDGALTMGELARRACITEKTITGVVDRLERDGLLQRVRDQQDRRVVRVVLTEQGTKTFEIFRRHMRERLGFFLSLIDESERETMLRILEKLRDRFAQMAAAATGKENAP